MALSGLKSKKRKYIFKARRNPNPKVDESCWKTINVCTTFTRALFNETPVVIAFTREYFDHFSLNELAHHPLPLLWISVYHTRALSLFLSLYYNITLSLTPALFPSCSHHSRPPECRAVRRDCLLLWKLFTINVNIIIINVQRDVIDYYNNLVVQPSNAVTDATRLTVTCDHTHDV